MCVRVACLEVAMQQSAGIKGLTDGVELGALLAEALGLAFEDDGRPALHTVTVTITVTDAASSTLNRASRTEPPKGHPCPAHMAACSAQM